MDRCGGRGRTMDRDRWTSGRDENAIFPSMRRTEGAEAPGNGGRDQASTDGVCCRDHDRDPERDRVCDGSGADLVKALKLPERIRRQQEREKRYQERIKDKYSNFRNLTQRWDDPENEFRITKKGRNDDLQRDDEHRAGTGGGDA